MLPLLKKVAIQNTDTPSTIALLSNIMEGVDGSGAFNLTNDVTDIKIEDNQTRQTRQVHTLDIRAIFDPTEAAKVAAMQAVGTPALITGLTPDGVVLFGKPVQITRGKVYDEVSADKYIASLAAPSGYQGAAPNKKTGVYVGKNLLGIFDVTTGSALTGNQFLNGFKVGPNAISSASVATGQQTITVAGATTNNIFAVSENVFFPFVGTQITASADVVSRTETSLRIAVQFLSATNTVLSTETSSNTGTGINFVTSTAPADTVSIRFAIVAGSASGGATIVFQKPMLTIDGSTQFQL